MRDHPWGTNRRSLMNCYTPRGLIMLFLAGRVARVKKPAATSDRPPIGQRTGKSRISTLGHSHIDRRPNLSSFSRLAENVQAVVPTYSSNVECPEAKLRRFLCEPAAHRVKTLIRENADARHPQAP